MKQFIFLLSIIICSTNYAQSQLWGMNYYGGTTSAGNIFKTDGNGSNFSVEHDFFEYDGIYPGRSSMIEVNGKLYGVVADGGLYSAGVIFQYDPVTNNYLKLHDFNDVLTGDGPTGSLLKATDGMLYGMTSQGGTSGLGTLFQFNPITLTFTKKINFTGTTNGSNPIGSLMQASDGMIYGMTSQGGVGATGGVGLIFQYNPITSVLVKKIDFNTIASLPQGSLIEAFDGKLYGTTMHGGVNGDGILFQYDPLTNICTKKIDFLSTATGNDPYGSLLQASDSMLYAVTYRGGVNNKGVLFQYNPVTNAIVKKHDFTGTLPPFATGSDSYGNLIQASNGLLYGLNSTGGSSSGGTLFEYNISTSVLTKKKDMSVAQGFQSLGSLFQASDGKLYGFTQGSLLTGFGTLFQYDAVTNILTKKIEFNAAINGKYGSGALMLASNNMLYGVTEKGGINNTGVLFQYNPINHSYSKKLDFIGTVNGSLSKGALIQASDGKLYGMTTEGGTNNFGVLFQYDIVTNTYIKKIDFVGTSNGSKPFGVLMQASDGKLYGMTSQGGTNNSGVLFQYDISTNTLVKKIDFSGSSNGGAPKGGLMQASDGKLYGMTEFGGVSGEGTLFQYDPITNVLIKKIDFDGSSKGRYPKGSLIQASDGNLYGVTANGGSYNYGALFQYNPVTSFFWKKFNFDRYTSGGSVDASLLQAIDGNIYMPTGIGGANDFGTILQYNLTTSAITKIMDFNGINGSSSMATLIEIPLMIGTNTVSTVNCAGSNVTIPFSVSGSFGSGNVFTAQLSDATGSFASPINIGTVSSITSDSINGMISSLIAQGNGYRIRIVSSNPVIIGSDNGINITINACSDVWPGDANSDGTTDNVDVLELGLHFTQTGAPRATTSNSWQSYFANNWTGTISNGKNLNHSDCNGDGIINDDDTLAIYNNYGLIHAFKPTQTTTVNPQLSVVPDQAMVTKGNWGTASIYLGDATTNINNINGVAFTIDFDNTLIEPSNVWIEYQNSFIDASQNLYFRKLDFSNSKLFTASTHTVSNNVSGFGKIATLHYQILSSLTTDQVLNIGILQANQSNATGLITPLTSGTGTLMAIGTSVGVKEVLMSGNVLISPNPTNGILNISFNTIPQNTKIEIYSTLGALVMSEQLSDKNNTINISNLSSAVYYMKVLENNKVIAVKKVVKE